MGIQHLSILNTCKISIFHKECTIYVVIFHVSLKFKLLRMDETETLYIINLLSYAKRKN